MNAIFTKKRPSWSAPLVLAASLLLSVGVACDNDKAPETKEEAPAKAETKAREGRGGKKADVKKEAKKMPNAIPAPADVAAPPKDAEVTASGLASKVLKAGTGTTKPTAESQVQVHYTGWTTDGNMFDSSKARGKPATFPLNRVIKGWTEGLQLMVAGEQRRFWIPVDLAYQGRPGAPAGMLVFDVELLEIIDPPKAPADVAAIPKDAKVTSSGLASRVLKKGTGTEHPTATSKVSVHYSGWTTDGKMFDSSLMRGQPASFRLNQVIAGWTEGVQLMTAGEKRLFWIPEKLAYQGRPGAPAGMLVFEVELLEIQ